MLQITGVCYIYVIENLNISNHVLGTFALYVETSLLLFAFFFTGTRDAGSSFLLLWS